MLIISTAPAQSPPPAAGYLLSPKAFRAAVDQVLPSMVTIETFGSVLHAGGPAPARPPGPGAPGRGPRRGAMGGISNPGEGPTTGLVVSADGLIVTSTFNFLRQPSVITVVLQDGSQHVAKLLGRDETRKLCLLKIDLPEGKALPVPRFVPAGELEVGQWAISAGVGYGDDNPAISAGIISGKNRIFGKAVQTDANISPANYGGPLVDIQGRVIGVCVPLSPMGADVAAGSEWYDSGIGFAVPLAGAEAQLMLAQLKAGRIIQPGKMGVQLKPATSGGDTGEGVVVQAVVPDSPAQKAAVQVGDAILAVDTKKVEDIMALRSIMGRYIAGEQVTLTLGRAGKEVELTLTLDAGADAMPQPAPLEFRRPPGVPGTQPAPRPGR